MADARDTTATMDPPHRRVLRVGVLSDLHLECDRAQPAMHKILEGRRRLDRTPVDDTGHPLYGPRLDGLRDVDLVLACGDVDVKTWPVAWLDAAARYTGRPWFYVMGNHESYDRPIENALRDLREGCAVTSGRVTLLENDRADLSLDGFTISVLGCTLWTDHAVARQLGRPVGDNYDGRSPCRRCHALDTHGGGDHPCPQPCMAGGCDGPGAA